MVSVETTTSTKYIFEIKKPGRDWAVWCTLKDTVAKASYFKKYLRANESYRIVEIVTTTTVTKRVVE